MRASYLYLYRDKNGFTGHLKFTLFYLSDHNSNKSTASQIQEKEITHKINKTRNVITKVILFHTVPFNECLKNCMIKKKNPVYE